MIHPALQLCMRLELENKENEMFLRLVLMIPMIKQFMLLDVSIMPDDSEAKESRNPYARRLTAEEALRKRETELQRQQDEAAKIAAQAKFRLQEKTEQRKRTLLLQLTREQRAAISRLQDLDWNEPRGALGTVIVRDSRFMGLLPSKSVQMALWPVYGGVYLGSDGNLWHDPAQLSVLHSRMRRFDQTSADVERLRLYLTELKLLGARS